MDTGQVLALLFVFLTNVVVVVGLGWVIFQLQQSRAEMYTLLRTAAQDLLETGRGLRGLGSGVDRLLERMAGAERQASVMLRSTADSVAAMDGRLRHTLETTLNELLASGVSVDSDLHKDLRRLIESLENTGPGEVSNWADRHQNELNQVIGQCDVLLSENQQLQTRIDEMTLQMDGLRSVQRAQEASEVELQTLREALDRQLQVNARLRNDVREADHRANTADVAQKMEHNNAEQLRDEVHQQTRRAELAERRAQDSAAEVEALHQAVAKAQADLDRQRAEMDRLVREKDFIEDKFLGLDTQVEADDAARV